MSEKRIVTISRQYGSGGRYIGRLLAEKLGVPFYDKDIIHIAAKESGLSEEIMERLEESSSTRYLFMQRISSDEETLQTNMSYSVPDLVYLAESKAIRQIAEQGPCVIVGRCADYILRDRDDVLHVFITAPFPKRIERVTTMYNTELSLAEAAEQIMQVDKRRRRYRRAYTDDKWSRADNYHITLDSSLMEAEDLADLLVDFVKKTK